MFNSASRPAPPPSPPPPLPPGWTQYQAPSGAAYYYHTETGQSTYTRPQAAQPPTALAPPPAGAGFAAQSDFIPLGDVSNSYSPFHSQAGISQRQQQTRPPRREPHDRPKSKSTLRGCRPWLLIKTKLGRRFVHNPETGESYWKFPAHVAKAVVQFDVEEAQRVGRRERGEPSPEQEPSPEPQRGAHELQHHGAPSGVAGGDTLAQMDALRTDNAAEGVSGKAHGTAEEEEFDEIIEEEEDDGEHMEDHEAPAKRSRTDEQESPPGDTQVEFGEDDMEWQLQQMGQAYDLLPGEYGGEDENYDEDIEGMQLTDEDATTLFEDLLEDKQVSPYATWDSIIDEGVIIEDDRYTVLTSMKARREAFAAWSTRKAQELRDARAKQEKQNPKILYLDLLQRHATPKLYWPEFKRKFKKEPEMKDHKLSDKDREKIYREYIHRTTKMSESDRRHDLRILLQSIRPSQQWHRGLSIDRELPESLLVDLKFVSLKPRIRDEVVRDFVAKLPNIEELRH